MTTVPEPFVPAPERIKLGGLSWPVLAAATVLCIPAFDQAYDGTISAMTLMIRWIAIVAGCWAVGEGARILMTHSLQATPPVRGPAGASGASDTGLAEGSLSDLAGFDPVAGSWDPTTDGFTNPESLG